MDDKSLGAMKKVSILYSVNGNLQRAGLVGRIFHAMEESGEMFGEEF